MGQSFQGWNSPSKSENKFYLELFDQYVFWLFCIFCSFKMRKVG